LLVDDDAFFREVTITALKGAGYGVIAVSDGREVVKKIQDDGFDLVITDIFMPYKDGIEVIQEIRAIHPTIKIITISSDRPTGYRSFLDVAKILGSNGSLEKPFNHEQLLSKINDVMQVAK
ncbi:MAG: response regulator, partial [Micavibrio sp.]|nr:response regulator [Micavibrio sp.]